MMRAVPIALVAAASDIAQTDWPVYGHDPGGMRHSPLKQINASNVKNLTLAWVYRLNTSRANAM